MREYLLYVDGDIIQGGGTMPATIPVDRRELRQRRRRGSRRRRPCGRGGADCLGELGSDLAFRAGGVLRLGGGGDRVRIATSSPALYARTRASRLSRRRTRRSTSSPSTSTWPARTPSASRARCRLRPRPTPGCSSTGSRSAWSRWYPRGTGPTRWVPRCSLPRSGPGTPWCGTRAQSTSACSGLLAEVIAESGPASGRLQLPPRVGSVVGDAMVAHSGVDAVGFVGSVATGRKVAESAGAGKTQVLELGGNGPMVILEDADLDLATEATLEAAYLCAGQSCTAGERFLVHSSVRAEYRRAGPGRDGRKGAPRRSPRPCHDNGAPQQRVERPEVRRARRGRPRPRGDRPMRGQAGAGVSYRAVRRGRRFSRV